jgi:hypothetical protein
MVVMRMHLHITPKRVFGTERRCKDLLVTPEWDHDIGRGQVKRGECMVAKKRGTLWSKVA